ncbi:hypothetical protein [Pedobacter immunditicola]|uniref:hypothetical protein n=1 Tax=Pedobacter immunditicola TaxID=3133440 RepID=UPI0030AF024D
MKTTSFMYKNGVSSLFLKRKISGKQNIKGAGILNVSVKNIPKDNAYRYKIINKAAISFMVFNLGYQLL